MAARKGDGPPGPHFDAIKIFLGPEQPWKNLIFKSRAGQDAVGQGLAGYSEFVSGVKMTRPDGGG